MKAILRPRVTSLGSAYKDEKYMKIEDEVILTTTHLIKILKEYIFHQFADHDGVFLPVVSQETRVRELVEKRGLDATAGFPLNKIKLTFPNSTE